MAARSALSRGYLNPLPRKRGRAREGAARCMAFLAPSSPLPLACARDLPRAGGGDRERSRRRSVQRHISPCHPELGRFDQLGRGDLDGVKLAIKRSFPKIEETP